MTPRSLPHFRDLPLLCRPTFGVLVLGVCLCASLGVRAQERLPPSLRLGGLKPAFVRNSVTEAWVPLEFNLTNWAETDRLARVLVFYKGQEDMHYGRDVWLPAHSILSTWMLLGPAPEQGPANSRDIEYLLYDRTDGKDELLLPPGEERVRSRGVLYRKALQQHPNEPQPPREPPLDQQHDKGDTFTTVLIDEAPGDIVFGQLPQPEPKVDEAYTLVRTFRAARNLGELVQRVSPGFLPATPQAFDSLRHFVVASNRIAQDPAGMQALRRWLERGGKVWVMLDMVDADVVAPLLGDAFDFQVVDHVTLTDFTIDRLAVAQSLAKPPPGQLKRPPQESTAQHHDRPVDFVRVLLPSHERVLHTINGWPVWFTRRVGHGRVVFTTLGPRGWFRERGDRELSPHRSFPTLPVPLEPLEVMGAELQPPQDEDSFDIQAFVQPLSQEIGYAVVGRGIVALIFGAFLLATLALGIALRRSSRPELLGWLAPVAALAAAAGFVALGQASRHAVPPTVGVAQIVDADSGTAEAAVHGLLELYRPDSGSADYGAKQGGFFQPDVRGSEGKIRRWILTDMDAWHWENLALPAGERSAEFHYTVSMREPITALAHFGPDGLEGKLVAGPFKDPSDALLSTPDGRFLAVQMRPDGTFRAGPQDVLPKGQYLGSALLTDQQQRRQELYRTFLKQHGEVLKRPGPGRLDGRNVLLAWAEPCDMQFTLEPKARAAGTALLVVPLQLERAPSGAQVTIPAPLLPYRRITERGWEKPSMQSELGMEMELRFQLPLEVLPLKIEQARLALKIIAPGRVVTIAGHEEGKLVEIRRVESPLDPIRLTLAEERFLRLDPEGGLRINLTISQPRKGGDAVLGVAPKDEQWKIDYLDLEISGRSEG